MVNWTDSSDARSGIISKTQALEWRGREETRVPDGFKAWASGENLLPSTEKGGWWGANLGRGACQARFLVANNKIHAKQFI